MKIASILFFALVLFSHSGWTANDTKAKPGEWWNLPYPQAFDPSQLKNDMDSLKVDGNRIVNESGKTFVLRGINISDPDKLAKNGKWGGKHFKQVKKFGANVVRIPVHPTAWQSRGEADYFRLLDQAVVWANELNMYLIIDWHSIGNLETGVFQHPMYYTNKQETLNFWRSISFRYKNVPTIAVYEIFNEPTDYVGQLGKAEWSKWKAFNETAIDIIYAHDTSVIPLVAGFNWAYDLSPIANEPIERNGIAYAAHPYPQKTKAPFKQSWTNSWGFAADKYPLILTEIGFMKSTDPGAHIPVIDDEGVYGDAIVKYMDEKGLSFTVWCFDPDWPSQIISDWNYTLTWQGEFFKKVLHERNH